MIYEFLRLSTLLEIPCQTKEKTLQLRKPFQILNQGIFQKHLSGFSREPIFFVLSSLFPKQLLFLFFPFPSWFFPFPSAFQTFPKSRVFCRCTYYPISFLEFRSLNLRDFRRFSLQIDEKT